MKREFLETLKVGEQSMSKEMIDTIMAENGRDIENAKKPYADYNQLRQQLQTARDSLAVFQDADIKSLQEQIAMLQGQLQTKDTEYQGKLAEMAFENTVKQAVSAAGGRNIKAISALLNLDQLKNDEDPQKAVGQALEKLKQTDDYLFSENSLPPRYARETGADLTAKTKGPATLAGVLREKFERK